MTFEKTNVNVSDDFEATLQIVCCSGFSCKDTSGNVYDDSKSKSMELYGPTHSSTNSCTS